MLALLKILPDAIKLPVAMLLGGLIAYFPARWGGINDEKERAEAVQLSRTLEIIRERNATDAEVSSSDAATMCGFMGLSAHDYAECVRLSAQTNPVTGNVGVHNSERPQVCGPSRGEQRTRPQTGMLGLSTAIRG